MNEQFESALNQIAEEKDLDKAEILKMIEVSLAAAFRKDYGKKDQNIVVEFFPETLATKAFDVKKVVEVVEDPVKEFTVEEAKAHKKGAKVGDEIKIDITPKTGATFGRIAAQTSKQVIVQKIREAERGVLFPSEQIKGEKYSIGARIKVLILHVEPTAKGPKITLSRSHPDVVRRLFELEVPEIFNGIVEVKAIAREAGSRTKIAVWSLQDGVDPIGACVGQRGTRVQVVMNELGGEKIDIISWAEDAVKFIANALSPAKILNVTLNEDAKEAKVGVLEDQLSLAIGKAGQNVRLPARLTGWKIDIAEEKIPGSEPETKKEEEAGTEELNPEAIPAEGEAKNESE